MKVIPTGLFAFGALHGYLPPEKRSRSDFWKAFGIGTTGVFLHSISTMDKPHYSPGISFAGCLIGSLIAPGFCICTGMIVGKTAARVLQHSEDS